ncbi:MAG TPA: hypothetical protein VLH19_03990 [Patescibacteria group bacterium]|nr:hypothetical protein [Patescibacteria group bacterium]
MSVQSLRQAAIKGIPGFTEKLRHEFHKESLSKAGMSEKAAKFVENCRVGLSNEKNYSTPKLFGEYVTKALESMDKLNLNLQERQVVIGILRTIIQTSASAHSNLREITPSILLRLRAKELEGVMTAEPARV